MTLLGDNFIPSGMIKKETEAREKGNEGREMRNPTRKRERLYIFIVMVLSFILIYMGNRIAMKDLSFFTATNDLIVSKGEVTAVLDQNVNEYGAILFESKILEGKNKGETVIAGQIIDPDAASSTRIVEEGDVIFLGDATEYVIGADWFLYEFERFNGVVWLGIAFALLLLLFGRGKGFRTIVSLAYTCGTIFFVFIPSIISGFNIYVTSILICIFITFMTLLIVQGPNTKTLAAGLGCMGGLLAVSLITAGMSEVLKITGLLDSESFFLLYIDTDNPINLKAIVFAAITIGAMGAILDIAVDIAASLSEVHRHAHKISLQQTIKSGITIGQDIVGSMANTLILAYIGSSLSLILLLLVHSGSTADLLNSELITVEFLQALAGSIGILFTIPLTSISCGILYNLSDAKDHSLTDAKDDNLSDAKDHSLTDSNAHSGTEPGSLE